MCTGNVKVVSVEPVFGQNERWVSVFPHCAKHIVEIAEAAKTYDAAMKAKISLLINITDGALSDNMAKLLAMQDAILEACELLPLQC